MLQNIIDFLFSRHSIGDALTHFDKAVAKLEAVEKQEVAKMERRKAQIAKSIAALDIATKTATIARNKATKIRSFFGDSDEDTADNINTLRAIG